MGRRIDSRTGSPYSAETLHWLEGMTGQLALIVKNAWLVSDLEETLNKLQLAYRRTIDAQEEERRSLATEIHDDILGRLTTMALTLRNSQKSLESQPAQVQTWLKGLEKETQELNRRLREITQGLHPSVLADLGFRAADCVAFEDSSNGLRAATAAGLKTVITPNRFTAHHDFKGALRTVADLTQVSVPRLREWHAC